MIAYDFKNLKGDLIGGLMAGIVALPLAMAFGVESGLGAAAGLVGAIALGSIASLLGGTPLLVSGPTATMTVASSIIIAGEIEKAGSFEAAMSTIVVIFILTGAFQIIFGFIRLGQYIRFVPYPLISGFLSGIGILMIAYQFYPLTGHDSTLHIWEIISGIPTVINSIQWPALVLGLSTILIVYLFPKVTKAVPSTLVALVTVSLAAYLFALPAPVIGDITGQWMQWRWTHLLSFDHTLWNDVLVPALTLALLGSIDTLLSAIVSDMMTNTHHKSNRELIGQGLGNMLSALAGGLPGAGATLRTVLNVNSGAKTRLASFFHSLLLLLVLLEVGPFISHIPLAVMSGILITVGISIIDYKGLRDIRKIPFTDAVVMLVVLVATIFVGLLQAFATGIILASVFFVKKMADQNMRKYETVVLMPEKEDELQGVEAVYHAREIYIQELSGPLFFGFAAHFKEAFEALPHMRAVIFRMERVPFVDQSGLYALQTVLQQLRNKNIIVMLTGLQDEPEEQLHRINIIPELVKEEWIFRSFAHGADWLTRYLKQNPVTQLKKINLQDQLGLKRMKDRLN